MRTRMKFQDPEKPLRRRRQSERTESGDLSSSSSTHESYQHSSGISVSGDRDYYIHTLSSNDANKTRSSSIDSNASDVFEAITRRMSSPLSSSHGAGVVTASLKIPVQASAPVTGISSSNAVHGQQTFYIHEKPSHNIGDNITDIPFIEDNSSSFELSDDGKTTLSQIIVILISQLNSKDTKTTLLISSHTQKRPVSLFPTSSISHSHHKTIR